MRRVPRNPRERESWDVKRTRSRDGLRRFPLQEWMVKTENAVRI